MVREKFIATLVEEMAKDINQTITNEDLELLQQGKPLTLEKMQFLNKNISQLKTFINDYDSGKLNLNNLISVALKS